MLTKYSVSLKSAFDIDWNQQGILIGCEDMKAVIIQCDSSNNWKLDSFQNVAVDSAVRSVAWNAVKHQTGAVGLFSGIIVIIEGSKGQIMQKLGADCNLDRVMCLQWHPHFDYILASGSCDNTVRIWDIKNNGHKSLSFHEERVRSVSWNFEIPWLLVSGADDSQIALWDIRSNSLITSIVEPCISVSGITSHPKTPFALITSHLDNSVIFWDLLDLPEITTLQLKFLLDFSLTDIICDPHDQMAPKTSEKLSGEVSKMLQMELHSHQRKLTPREKFIKILGFFN
mmetsp:Transcript_44909/g.43482  ORF Transcript_44909/g.43482 Transcript_44909/m.43482 type:complete len:285 (-) Transcript_44909:1660-2514(-)